jgi:hypothetical protein
LACALGHRVKKAFGGRLHWFRVGAWDARTVGEMLALRFGTARARRRLFPALVEHFSELGSTFIVLDNHEDDRAMARVLDELRAAPVTWVITARRCLLSGISIFPVTAPLVTSGKSAFPRVGRLTKLLRYNPLGLDIADALVASGAASVRELESWLLAHGIERVRVIDHEDDLPEVRLLVDYAYGRLGPSERRLLAVLAHTGGDHMGAQCLVDLARVGARGAPALRRLLRWHLVQEPLPSRYALHAVVQYALRDRARIDPRLAVEYHLALLERDPTRFDLEQTHFFAAMDFAHASSDLALALRIDELYQRLAPEEEEP